MPQTKSTNISKKKTGKTPSKKSIFDLNNKSEAPKKTNEALGYPRASKLKQEIDKEMEKFRRGI